MDQPQGQQLPPAPKLSLSTFEQLPCLQLITPRQIPHYQRELAQPGINGENYIFCAPTGTGKTLIAGLVISDRLQKRQNLEKKVIFVVSRRSYAEQQARELQGLIPGAEVVLRVGSKAGRS